MCEERGYNFRLEKNLSILKWYSQLVVKVVELEIAYERIRQARHSYNLALTMTAGFSVLAVIGGITLSSGKFIEGAVATAGGSAPIVRCLKLARESNDRLDKLLAQMRNSDPS